jgi:hypothetical protein
MSLNIDTDSITAVLLADGWHEIIPKTFRLDAYEFIEEGEIVHKGGQSGVSATGFNFQDRETHMIISGPLTAILAVRRSP